jgi:gliding motility-associated-like protein
MRPIIMRNFIFTFVFIILTNFVNAQLCLGNDTTLCIGQSVTINDCSNIGGGAGTGTAAYTITNIPYNPDPFNAGTSINLSDDQVSSVLNIGFSFCFFGNTYTQFYVGSNGWVGFTAGQTTSFTSATVPSTGATVPKNCIMAPWQDWHPGTGSNIGNYIKYQVLGTAPFRRLVVSWNGCPLYSCTTNLGTFQIVLFETSNNIETRIQNKPACLSWPTVNPGNAVHGLHNLAGNVAVVVPGRNSTQWTATNEAKRFSPGATWGNTLGQSFPYNGGVLNVNPVPPGTTGYFLKAGCGTGSGTAISDTTWITLANPSVTVTKVDDVCTQSIGSVTAIPGPGSPAPISYNWTPTGATSDTVNNLLAGSYTVNIVDGNGCTSSATAIVGDFPATFSGTTTQVSCTGGNDGTATANVTPSNGSETYEWSNGQTTQTATGLVAGNYWCFISSTSGCSDTVYLTVTEIPALQLAIANQQDANCYTFANGSATITVTQGTIPYTYLWSQSASTTNVATDLAAGVHIVTVTDANGCEQTISVTIGQPLPLVITSITPNTQICPGSSLPLNVTVSGGSSPYIYSWESNSNVVGTSASITIRPSTSGTVYCVNVSETCGSPAVDSCLTITFPTPINPYLNPDEVLKCVPGDFTFTNTSSNIGEIQSTEYSFSNGQNFNINGSQGFSNTFPNAGNYDVTITSTSIYGCIYDTTISNIVVVVPLPVADFTISKNPATWFETTIQTSDNSTGAISQWNWSSPGATSITNGGTTGIIEYTQGVTGTYPITLTVSTPQGCSDSITLNIEIVPDIILYVPNSFTPDGDEHNQKWNFYIDGIDLQNFEVVIYNRWGEVIWESHDANESWDGTYGGYKVPQGTYSWKISYKEKDSDGRKYHTGFINILK